LLLHQLKQQQQPQQKQQQQQNNNADKWSISEILTLVQQTTERKRNKFPKQPSGTGQLFALSQFYNHYLMRECICYLYNALRTYLFDIF